jgi:hypothetical protein
MHTKVKGCSYRNQEKVNGLNEATGSGNWKKNRFAKIV